MAFLGDGLGQQTRRAFELRQRGGTTYSSEVARVKRGPNQRRCFEGDQRGARHRIMRIPETEVTEHRVEVVNLLYAGHG
jgi:hypothetical protein